MGWASGSEIADKIWKKIKIFIPPSSYGAITREIYEIFEEYDADDWSYQLYEDGSLYETYLRLNEPETYKELKDETC